MGDYSGGLVLEVATEVDTVVAASVTPAGPDALVVTSEPFGTVSLPLAHLRDAAAAAGGHAALSLPGVAAYLKAAGAPFWAFYVYGSLAVFVRETGWTPPPGAGVAMTLTSTVPTAQGVSSSASVEVATLRALAALAGVALAPLRVAHIAQAAENYVCGAPCGLMDQLASSCGAPGQVLPIVCRPDAIAPPMPLPAGVALVGWPSGVKHSISGVSPYLVARTAAFMGKKMAEAALGGERLAYASQITPYVLRTRVSLPAAVTGKDFLAAHGGVDDGLSVVEPGVSYPVAAALEFAVDENFRCGLAVSLLGALAGAEVGGPGYTALLSQLGELMGLTHAGYTAIGLGCPETDAMVDALRAMGPAAGIYGARVSGGGSGGTVAVLLERSALPQLEALAQRMTFGTPFTGLIQ